MILTIPSHIAYQVTSQINYDSEQLQNIIGQISEGKLIDIKMHQLVLIYGTI